MSQTSLNTLLHTLTVYNCSSVSATTILAALDTQLAMPCSHYLCKHHCSAGTRWQMWWRLCQYRTLLRWMSLGLHSMRWKQRLCCKARSSCMWVCAWIACPSGDASASPVLGSGSSSPDSGFQGFLIPATIYDIIHLLTHFSLPLNQELFKFL